MSNRNRSKVQRNTFDLYKKDNKKKRARQSSSISGFSTLNQVAGVPLYREHHSNIPLIPTKTVQEPKLTCPRCNQRIENVSTAINTPSGELIHFDCALDELKKIERPTDKQTISYIGSGNFGLCEKDENGKWIIIKTIPFENAEKHKEIKEYVNSLKA